MARFLFVVHPAVGHAYRMRPYAEELADRGHEVAWAAHPAVVGRFLPPAQRVFGLSGEPAAHAAPRPSAARRADRSLSALGLGSLREPVEPLARASVHEVEAAVDTFRPDCLVNDSNTLAGGLAARRRGLPWATCAGPGLVGRRELFESPVVVDFLRRRLDPLQRELGLEPRRWPAWSPHLVVANTVREFIGDDVELDPQVRLVGAAVARSRDSVEFPWELLDGRPAVLASLGTVVQDLGSRFFAALAEALAGEPIQVVAVAGRELLPEPPPNFVVRPFVPQVELLRRVLAVVSHGGHNTVTEALVEGRPLVIAPIAYDQPYNAVRVQAAGAGLRVRFARPRAAEIRAAVRRVLREPAFVRRAHVLGRALLAPGGAAAAAAALEELAAAPGPAAP